MQTDIIEAVRDEVGRKNARKPSTPRRKLKRYPRR